MANTLFNAYYLQIFATAALMALIGFSAYLPLRAGIISVGTGGFMSIGAFTAGILGQEYGLSPGVGIIAAIACGAVAGLLLGLPTLRLRGIYLAIATLGFGEVVRVVFTNLEITGGALGIKGITSFDGMLTRAFRAADVSQPLGLAVNQASQLIVLVGLILLLVLLIVFLQRQERSRVGRALSAIREDETAAEVLGIDVVHYRLVVFVESAAIAGLGGGLYAYMYHAIGPGNFGYERSIDVLLYAVLGGSEVVWGPLLGSAILNLLPEYLRFLQDYRLMVYGAAVVLLMAWRPQGLLDQEVIDRLARPFRRSAEQPSRREVDRSVDGEVVGDGSARN